MGIFYNQHMKIFSLGILLVFNLCFCFGQTSVYIKGTGFNYNAPRVLKLNGQLINIPNGRGLCLTIIEGPTHQVISSKKYDTFGNPTESDSLAIALNGLKRGQIGILNSHDAWEKNVTENLKIAARRLGLFKMGSGDFISYRRPYAAIFRGSGTSLLNSESNHIAYEVMQSTASGGEMAIIATWLIDDAFIGNNLTNVLLNGDPNVSVPSLISTSSGNIGIGTYIADSKLSVNGKIRAHEIKLESINWPDYVFNEGYQLWTIDQIREYIQQNGHLPGLKSAGEYDKEGVEILKLSQEMLKKIEELTLHLIQKDSQINSLIEKVGLLEKKVDLLEKRNKPI